MDKPERWVLRIPSNGEGERFLAKVQKYLNKDTYKVSKHYTGPRPKGTNQHSTLKENATSVRLYIDSKIPAQQLPIWIDVMRENAKLKMRLDHVNTELAKVKALLDWRNY